jgi:hypothetical protein
LVGITWEPILTGTAFYKVYHAFRKAPADHLHAA